MSNYCPTNLSHFQDLRHTCEQDEGMAGYGWAAYDVRKGGIQIVNDTGNRLDLITEFTKISDDNWGLRVKGIPRANADNDLKPTVIFYLGSEDPNSMITCVRNRNVSSSSNDVICDGTTTGFPDFRLQIPDREFVSGLPPGTLIKSLTVPVNAIWQARSIFIDQLKGSEPQEEMLVDDPGGGNLHFIQKSFDRGFEFDVLFSSDRNFEVMTSTSLTNEIDNALSTFNERFKLVYQPQAPFQDEHHDKFSQSLLSNLMGGIGYFHGTSKVDVSSAPAYAETDDRFWEKTAAAQSQATIEEQGPYQLFSSIPSRPFFPRGFLWDEGFHLQVILDWDMDLALEVLSSWFDLMDEHGWIAREQILGTEARSKVPSQFQTQYLHYANPPTLFLVVQAFVARLDGDTPYSGAPSHYISDHAAGKAFLEALYPKLKKHYEWFCRTQAGNLEHYQLSGTNVNKGYRWRGRTSQHILTSGLDDYPRSQPPHPEELHLDALCWVGAMAMGLKEISAFLGETEDQALFLRDASEVSRSIDGIHWSEPDQAYCDTTIFDGDQVQRVCHKGYVSLFPFLLGFMDPDHPHLKAMLDLISDPDEVWSHHGIRSLSMKDKYYGTEENYWRSPVWININYLVVQQLLVNKNSLMPLSLTLIDTYTMLRNYLNNQDPISKSRVRCTQSSG